MRVYIGCFLLHCIGDFNTYDSEVRYAAIAMERSTGSSCKADSTRDMGNAQRGVVCNVPELHLRQFDGYDESNS